jgi:hypothetical protein
MKVATLKKDAIIGDVIPTLSNAEEYVRIVLGNLSACKKAHGNASVRIGITGQGKIPSHKVEYRDRLGELVLFGAFDQDRPFTDVGIQEHTWSTATLTFAEVQQLLGDIRNFRRA